MTTLFRIAAAGSMLLTTSVLAQPPAGPTYAASYDARSNRYCVRVKPAAGQTLVPTIVGRSCHTQAQWQKWGLTFDRKPAAAPVR